MRRKQRLVSSIKIATKTSTKNAIGETVTGWAVASEVQATVTPLSDAASVQMYGERASSMMNVICAGGLEKGMAVWLPGETGTPVWKVTSTMQWSSHLVATIERQVV